MAIRADEEVSKLKIKDEIGKNIQNHMKDQVLKELEMHKKTLEQRKAGLERFKAQLDRDKRIWEIMMTEDNFKRITPVFKYETIPEYWELAKGQIQDKIDMEKMQSEGRLTLFETEIKASEEQIQDCQAKLDDLNKEV